MPLEGIKMKNRILECISLGFSKRITHEVIKIIDEMDKVYKKNETSTVLYMIPHLYPPWGAICISP